MTATTLPNPYKTKTTQTRAYTYNKNDELTQTQVTNGVKGSQTYTYNYDKNGNNTTFTIPINTGVAATTHTLDTNQDKIMKKTYPNGKYIVFTYSPEGNLTSKARYKANASLDTLTGYVYNYQNQLKHVKDFREIIITYGYDPQGQRIYAQTPSGTKFYLWDLGGRIISEGTPTQDYIVRYIYSGNEKIAMIRNNQVYYFVNNAQGTPAIIMDSAGKIISRQQMDEYGNLEQNPIGPAGNKNEVNFTGKKLDPETGLIYFNQRYYDPELGRFMQEDPMGQGPTPYTYCANNPLTYIDPDGQLFGIDDWIIGAIIGAVITGCGKDLKNPDTWFDIAIGATAGAFGGVFVDTVASEGAFNWMATVANEEGAMAMLGGGAVKWAMGDGQSSSASRPQSQSFLSWPDMVNVSEPILFADNDLNAYSDTDSYNPIAQAQAAVKNSYMNMFAGTRYGFLDWHYFRNVYNDPGQASIIQSKLLSLEHGKNNIKLLSLNGHHESVLDPFGHQVGGIYRATYNYGNQKGVPGFLDHGIRDYFPHKIFGP